MDEDPKIENVTRAIRSLTIAVWCLCVAVFGQLLFYAWGYLMSMRWARQTTTATSTMRIDPTPSRPSMEDLSELNGFHDLAPEEKVSHASVILLTTYQDDGNRNKAVVAEIVKQSPKATMYYSVGDEYPKLSFEKKEGTSCGEGQVVFMVGSPAVMASAYSFTKGRIDGMGDMPLTKLRELAKQNETAKQRKS